MLFITPGQTKVTIINIGEIDMPLAEKQTASGIIWEDVTP